MPRLNISLNADQVESLPVGSQLRTAREQAGITLTAMADRTGLNKGYLSEVERGNRPVSSKVRSLYVQVLGQQEVNVMSQSDKGAPQVVVAGTLRTLKRQELQRLTEVIDEPVKRVCERLGLSCAVPDRTPLVSESDTNPRAASALTKQSGALLAYVGLSDARTGVDVGFALTTQVPIILLYEVGNTRVVNEFRRNGIPVYGEVPFQGTVDLEDNLGQILFWLFSFRNLEEAARDWPVAEYRRQQQQFEQFRREVKQLIRLRPPISVKEWENWRSDPTLGQLVATLALAR